VLEIITDLANEISHCEEWDPDTLFNPTQVETPVPELIPDKVPLGLAFEMSLLPPPVQEGKVDVLGFIDNLINIFLDTEKKWRLQPHVVPLAAHLTNRPHSGDESGPVPC
jgi:hypothetical protein